MAQDGVALTEDEAQLYDRQIRLWGLESQKRLRCARVLVVGIDGLGAEVCKNLILAGVKAVLMIDHEDVTEEDSCAQFLAPTDSIGENRALASLERAQALNPNVEVTASGCNVMDKPDVFFRMWDVVVAISCSPNLCLWLNDICRSFDKKFFCGDVSGFFGYFFVDLNKHVFSKETVVVKLKDQKYIRNTETKKFTYRYIPLKEALNVDWAKEPRKSSLAKQDFTYFLMKILLRFRSENSRKPKPGSESDVAVLKLIRTTELSTLKVPEEKVPDSILNKVFGQISPVCAIVGGVLAQEVIKTVSLKDPPHNNFFFFNPETNVGQVLHIHNDGK